MEGTDNGRGQPVPRWRRVLRGARTGEQPEISNPHPVRASAADLHWRDRVAGSVDVPPGMGQPGEAGHPAAVPHYPVGSGHAGRVGYPAQPAQHRGAGYPPGTGYPPAGGYPTGTGYAPAPPSAPDYRPESADGYVGESRWALLEQARYVPAPRRGSTGIEPHRLSWREPRPDVEHERAVEVLRRDLGGPRVLAFANPKGGVHKTTATVLAAATIGSVRGRGVLAWDDNELRGTLGLRAGSARHARTIRHLIADLAMVEIQQGPALFEALDGYLRHASDGSYDVLAGEESPRFAHRLDQHTVQRVIELLRRTHDVICVDTGNNVESVNWQTVMRAADQLVVTTVPREDAAFTADWMLDLLHEVGMGELADNAVTLLSCPTSGPSPLLDDLRRHFASRTRAVAVVPYDPALESGSAIEYDQLQPETRRAWLMATAMMLEPFGR